MNFGLVLLVLGGFLLGGAWSIWRSDDDTKGRTGPQVAFAVDPAALGAARHGRRASCGWSERAGARRGALPRDRPGRPDGGRGPRAGAGAGRRRLVADRRGAVPDGVERADRAAAGHRHPRRGLLLLRRRHVVGCGGRRHPGRARSCSPTCPCRWRSATRRGCTSGTPTGSARRRRPFRDCADAIDSFAAVCCCYGVTVDRDGAPRVYAPHGYDDLFSLIVRPNRAARAAARLRGQGRAMAAAVAGAHRPAVGALRKAARSSAGRVGRAGEGPGLKERARGTRVGELSSLVVSLLRLTCPSAAR